MKEFINPVMDILELTVEDVIATSEGGNIEGDGGTGSGGGTKW